MFKESFKYYKTRKENMSFQKVYDLNVNGANFKVKMLQPLNMIFSNILLQNLQVKGLPLINNTTHFTLKPPELWEVYKISEKPGAFCNCGNF